MPRPRPRPHGGSGCTGLLRPRLSPGCPRPGQGRPLRTAAPHRLRPARPARGGAAGHAGSWSRASAAAQRPLGARGVGLRQEAGSHCRRGREEPSPQGPQDSALGDGERLPRRGSLGGGRAGGASGVEWRAGFSQPGPAAGRGRAWPFLWRRRADGKEGALGGLAGAAGPCARQGRAGPGRIRARRQQAAGGAVLYHSSAAWRRGGLIPAVWLGGMAGSRRRSKVSVKLSRWPREPEGLSPPSGPTPRRR